MFSMMAVPDVVEEVVTVSLIVSPALMDMLVNEYA
jgi:hypothetical protein